MVEIGLFPRLLRGMDNRLYGGVRAVGRPSPAERTCAAVESQVDRVLQKSALTDGLGGVYNAGEKEKERKWKKTTI